MKKPKGCDFPLICSGWTSFSKKTFHFQSLGFLHKTSFIQNIEIDQMS
jgi:hypothetical protein